jgi:predicted dehydrogenase
MKKYVFAGASSRAFHTFAIPLKRDFSNIVSLAGIYDINPTRSEIVGKECDIPVYYDFDEMLKSTKPDAVIVTTVDAYHHEYVIKALEAGCDAITEKPMTIDAQKCRVILEAERKTGKKVTVAFNYRFAPYMTRLKELVKSGLVGEIYGVDFEWLLDRNMDILAHGTSYFRRWNRYMHKSGGLLVHKATHHFDLVNWWINDRPVEVSAFGKLRRYGKNGKFRGDNCRACVHKNECEFYRDVTKDEHDMRFYVGAEDKDHYYIDGCVYAEDINIYDTMSVNVQYAGGALLTYSLNAHTPYEGWRIAINGSKGRIEAEIPESGLLARDKANIIKFFDLKNGITTYEVPIDHGGHGGGDERIRRMIFEGNIPDPLGHQASSIDGALSVLVGAAANVSIAEKRVVNIDRLIGDESLLLK